jgi:hypothetical protein
MVITRVMVNGQRYEIRNLEDFTRAERVLKSGMEVAFMVLQRDQGGTYRSGFLAVTIP